MRNKLLVYILFFSLLFQTIVLVPSVSAPEIIKPFDYVTTYAPPNSFGASDFTEQYVNWSWVNSHVTYSLKRDGVDVTNSLIVNFSTVFTYRKYSYSFTAGERGYFLLTLTFDSKATSSYMKDNVVYFNYSDGQLFYNYSDINSIQQIDKSFNLNNNVFIMTVGKNVNKNVRVVLDPTFGYSGAASTASNNEDLEIAGYFKTGVDDMVLTSGACSYYLVSTVAKNAKLLIYDSSKSLVANSVTNEKLIPLIASVHTWNFFTLSATPVLKANSWYYLCTFMDSGNGLGYYSRATAVSYSLYSESRDYTLGYTNPYGGSLVSASSCPLIYYNYTAINCSTLLFVSSVDYSDSSLSLSWTKGFNTDYTRIQYKTGSYPTNISDGTNAYNGTGSSHVESGLSFGTTYYFRGWSWNSTYKIWCSKNMSSYNTTNEYGLVFGTSSPVNQSSNQPLSGSWSILINETGGNTFNWSIEAYGQSSNANGASNGTKSLNYVNFPCSTKINVYLNVTNGVNVTNRTYWFNTILCTYCPWSAYNYTTNYTITWCVDMSVSVGTFNYTVNCSNGQNFSDFNKANDTYCFVLYNFSLNTTYYVWVNLTGTNCWDNSTYTVNLSFNASSSANLILTVNRDRFTLGLVIGSFSFILMGYVLYRRKRKS